MTITIRKAQDRGHFNYGWLDTWHSFSFGDYFDPKHKGFRTLRVINEDRVEPGQGFPTHGHRDMEIITYVLEGILEHKDSLGNGSPIRPGEVQRMSAGTGVTHSEINSSKTESVRLLQIWILPDRNGLPPSYEQKKFTLPKGKFLRVASRDGREGSVTVHQNVNLYAARLDRGEKAHHEIAAGRHAWIQVARGSARLNGTTLHAGDGAAMSEEKSLMVEADESSEILFFDLT